MDETTRRDLLDRLDNPRTPNPMLSADYPCLIRDIPPRRTLREWLRAVLAWRPGHGRGYDPTA